ncbi:hypothetical protein GR254_16730, partial [Mycobacterium tuberculosis]|nr:hypothetical protein [Mycobacterium tuberculosis]
MGDQPGVCGSQSASGARRRPRSSRRAAGGLGPDARGRVAVSWEALERTGIDPTKLRGSATGVFAGVIHA